MSQFATDEARRLGEPVRRVWVGYFCPRGGNVDAGGHFEHPSDPEFDLGCSGKGWDMFIEVEQGDLALLPSWMLAHLDGPPEPPQ